METVMTDPYADYMWASYLVGVLGLMLATWWLFRRHRELAQFCTITVAAWLLTPVALTPDMPQLAPAFFVFVLDGLFTDEPVARAAWPMALTWLGALVLSLLLRLLWRKLWPAKSDSVAGPSDAVADAQ